MASRSQGCAVAIGRARLLSSGVAEEAQDDIIPAVVNRRAHRRTIIESGQWVLGGADGDKYTAGERREVLTPWPIVVLDTWATLERLMLTHAVAMLSDDDGVKQVLWDRFYTPKRNTQADRLLLSILRQRGVPGADRVPDVAARLSQMRNKLAHLSPQAWNASDDCVQLVKPGALGQAEVVLISFVDMEAVVKAAEDLMRWLDEVCGNPPMTTSLAISPGPDSEPG